MALFKKLCLRLFDEITYLFRDLFHKLGVYNRFYKSARGSRIVIYHGICQQNHLKYNALFLTQSTLESHLKFYTKNFNIVSLDDYYMQKFSNDKFNICLTFDDGLANNYKYLVPLLKKYNVPVTFFVTSIRDAGYDILWNDFLCVISKYGPQEIVYQDEHFKKDRHNRYLSTTTNVNMADMLRDGDFESKAEMMKVLRAAVPFRFNNMNEDYWLQMTPEQISELSDFPLATIGSHGYYHNDLTQINISDAAREMALSKQYLESTTGKNINSFAFPYGVYNGALVKAAKKAGYQQLLVTGFNAVEDTIEPSMRERFTVNPFISVSNQMYAIVVGRY